MQPEHKNPEVALPAAAMPDIEAPAVDADESAPQPPSRYKWYQKLFGLLAVIFCFEIGIILLVFPWVTDWEVNYISSLPFIDHIMWNSAYFRGAISGLGVLNIYISFLEVFRLRRFSA